MKDKRVFYIVAFMSSLLISNAKAFVSYDEENSAPTPVALPTKKDEKVADIDLQKNKDLEDLYKGRVSPTGVSTTCSSGFAQAGKSPKLSSRTYKGEAAGIALAAEEIAPSGWKIIAKGAPVGFVEWKIKGTWAKAIGAAANSVGACAGINWKTKHIVIKSKEEITPKVEPVGKSQASFVTERIEPIPAPLPTITTENDKAKEKINKPSWTLRPGTTLKANLMEWCEIAGWKLAWHVKNTDYAITEAATISGTFYEAVNTVMTAYVDSSNPMAANIHEGNRVIEIIDHIPFQRNTITE